MYGTVAHFRLKPGMEGKMLDIERAFREAVMKGFCIEFTFRMDDDPCEYYEAILFESEVD